MSEAVHPDVTHALRRQIGRIDRMDRNAVAHQRKAEHPAYARPHDLQRDLRTAPAPQELRHIGARKTHGVERVDTHDAVVGPHAGPLGRTARNGIDHDNRIAQRVELHADTAELPVEALAHAAHLLGRQVGRMGIQPFEHPLDSPLDNRAHRLLVDIKFGQIPVDPGKLLQLLQIVGLLRRKGQHRKQRQE